MERSTESAKRPRAALDRSDRAAWLRKAELFSTLRDGEIAAVASHSRAYSHARGGPVFERGAPSDALYIVIEGKVRIEGEGAVIAELVSGDCFGELELLASRPRNARAVAEKGSRLLRFPRRGSSFGELLSENPALSASILHACLASVSRRIRSSNSLIKENSPWVQELRRQSYADKLTGLNNKTFLEERLSELSAAGEERFALVMLKPDNFKEINDSYGHEAGDAVLRAMAAELARSLLPGEEAARYQGNELAIVLPGTGREAAREEMLRIMRILNSLDLAPMTGGSAMRLSVSLGAALRPDHGSGAEALIDASRELPLVGRERGGGLVIFPEDR